ncbi:hypothetical protein DSECCO2_368800 [anaerobic digester metagenome]
MRQHTKKRRNLLQNIAIVLLTVSAVALFFQMQIYNLHSETGYLSGLLSSGSAQKTQSISGLSDLAMPVRIAVTGAYGRWASPFLTTESEEFLQPGNLLMEALGSAGSLKKCSAEDFQSALRSTTNYDGSIYYDFDSALPLSLLAGLVNADWTGGDLSARRLLLQAEEDKVRLFIWDGGDVFSICSTALTAKSLKETVTEYPLGSAWFAFDQPEKYSHVDPFSLFSEQLTTPSSLSVSSAITDASGLMSGLAFNPHTNSRYTEPSGAEVVLEGDRTLRIRPDGEISYQGGSGTLQIDCVGETPTEAEAVVGAYRLLGDLLPSQNDASLYLQELQSSETSTTLRFGYQYNGLPIRFADRASAAEITLEGPVIARLTLRVRQYTTGERAHLLLPLAQALSIARRYPGKELAIYYVDSGGSASAQWLAE